MALFLGYSAQIWERSFALFLATWTVLTDKFSATIIKIELFGMPKLRAKICLVRKTTKS